MSISSNVKTQIIPNKKQQECIDTINGPVMVLAGPGTGKTTVIIERIKKMLLSGIDGENIIALTFSEAAASEMKMRLLEQVGNTGSSVVIHTYHAFCSDLISQNPMKFEVYDNFNVIDELNKFRFMKEVIDEYRPKHLVTQAGDPYFFIPNLLMAVHDLKLNRITKEKYFNVMENNPEWKPELNNLKTDIKLQEELESNGKRNHLITSIKKLETLDSNIKKASEIWDMFERYTKKLSINRFIDFDDMINLVLNEFQNDPVFLEEVREKFQYILIDEYQDTNYSQNELIFQLASDKANTNIFVVGDDDQIIYSFQGAQIDNLERFLRVYPETKVICLNENNRSTQTILAFTYDLISQDTTRLEFNEEFANHNISKKLHASNIEINKQDKKVILNAFVDINQENNHILDTIQSIIDKNPELPLSEIAILTRTNPELDVFSDLCKARSIPFQVSRQKDLFALKPALLVYLYLKALENHNAYSMGLFGLVAHPPFCFNVNDYTFITKESQRSFKDFLSVIKDNLHKREWKDTEIIETFITTFDKLKSLVNDDKLSNLIIHIMNDTGILEHFASQEINRFENIMSLKKFVDEVRNFEKITKPATLTMLLAYLDDSINENIALELDQNNYIENAIQLLTVHKSKGREFSFVFMNNLLASKWEKRRGRNALNLPIEKKDFSKESEASRLLFVGCSRSKHYLSLSYSKIINNKNTELSKFIKNASINESIVNSNQRALTGEQYIDELIASFSQSPYQHNTQFKDDLKTRASAHVMSPSSMYCYKTCPKQFLFKHVYRIPVLESINKHFSFGSAVHKALEKYIKLAINNKKYSKREQLLKYFSQAIEKELFPSMQERSINTNRGTKALNDYYEKLIRSDVENYVDVELSFKLIPLDKYHIKGIIDLITINEDKTYTLIDYKTGNRNTTKNNVLSENGTHRHYLDQIQFYKVLFENRYPQKVANKGVLLFIEKPENSIDIDLTDEDTNSITDKIIKTFQLIHNLEFNGVDEEKQQHENCKNCDYKMLCKLRTL